MQRVCRVCSVSKSIHLFGSSSGHKDGVQTRCIPCARKAVSESRKRKLRNEPKSVVHQRTPEVVRLNRLNLQLKAA
jgi:hypothetical protein